MGAGARRALSGALCSALLAWAPYPAGVCTKAGAPCGAPGCTRNTGMTGELWPPRHGTRRGPFSAPGGGVHSHPLSCRRSRRFRICLAAPSASGCLPITCVSLPPFVLGSPHLLLTWYLNRLQTGEFPPPPSPGGPLGTCNVHPQRRGPSGGGARGGGSPLFEQRACAGEGGGGAWVGRAPEGLSKRAGAPRRPQRRARARIGEL